MLLKWSEIIFYSVLFFTEVHVLLWPIGHVVNRAMLHICNIAFVRTCICWCICICNIQLWGNVLWIADASSVGHWQPSEEEVSATVPWCPLVRRGRRILNQDKQQENISTTTGCSPCPPIKNRNQREVYCCLATLKYLSSRIKWSFANVYLLAAQCV